MPRGGTPPFLLGLDGVTDPQNLGALLRSAEGAGVTGVVLPSHRAVHVTPAVTKAAAGAVEHLAMAVVRGLPAALARRPGAGGVGGRARSRGRRICSVSGWPPSLSLVLGAEGAGLSRLARRRCDVLVHIPLHGALASLNVAAAGAIALFRGGPTTRFSFGPGTSIVTKN